MIGYQCKAINEEVTLSWEHDDYEWVAIEKAKTLDLPEFFKQMIASLKV